MAIKRIAILCLFLALLVLNTPPSFGAERQPKGARFSPGEVLVRLREQAPGPAVEAAKQAVGASKQRELKHLRVERWKVPAGKELEAIARLSRDPAVEVAQPNYIYQALADPAAVPATAQALPNDPGLSQQWGLSHVGAFEAWNTTSGDPSVVVAVIDSGLDFTHPDRPVNLVPGHNYVNPNDPNHPTDDFGHGTKVTGIIAAATNNGIGVAGVASRVSVMELKALDSTGWGTEFDVAEAIDYAANNGVRIINLSLGGTTDDQFMRDATNYAYGKGVLLVAAAGNAGSITPPVYPAAYPHVLAVAATDSTDQVAYFSLPGDYLDLAAPGVSIYSTAMGGSYESGSGTSFAAPHVAGVAALVWAARPSLTVDEVHSLLRATARDIGAPGWDAQTGWGLVDAAAAVRLASQGLEHLYLPLVGNGG